MARRVDPIFNELVAEALGLMPGVAPFADRPAVARLCAAVRASPEFDRWPGPCVALLAACEAVIDRANPMTALRENEIGRALDAEWPPVVVPAWQRRRDIGGLEDAA
jgi:hypothetical protein